MWCSHPHFSIPDHYNNNNDINFVGMVNGGGSGDCELDMGAASPPGTNNNIIYVGLVSGGGSGDCVLDMGAAPPPGTPI